MKQNTPNYYQNYPDQSENNQQPAYPPPPGTQVLFAAPQVRPLVTYLILALTIGVFLLQLGSDALLGYDLPSALGLKVNDLILRGQYWRLITPMLLHGNILHIGFNMYALYILGPGLERFYGHWRYLFLYLMAGFAGNVFSMIFTPEPSLGASTAIFGLFAAQGMFFFQNRRVLGRISQRALSNIILLAALNFILGLSPGIDNWGHLGGFIGGGMFAYLSGPLLEVFVSYPGYEVRNVRPGGAWVLATVVVGGFFSFLTWMTLTAR